MKENEFKNQNVFDFDEQGAVEVNRQIMDSYNSGFIDQKEQVVSGESEQTK